MGRRGGRRRTVDAIIVGHEGLHAVHLLASQSGVVVRIRRRRKKIGIGDWKGMVRHDGEGGGKDR